MALISRLFGAVVALAAMSLATVTAQQLDPKVIAFKLPDQIELIARIRHYNRTAEIIECAHQPLYLQDVYTGERLPLARLTNTYIGSICGIAAPESFEEGLRKLGARIELTKRFADHHRYSEGELQSFINRCIRRDVDMIVTTEKDAVRFPPLTKPEVPIFFLRVEILILSGHETWEHCVARICQPQPMLSPERFFS